MMKSIYSAMFPKEYCRSIYEYDFQTAYQNGKRLVLFDVDNTLVPHGAPADEKSIALIGGLKAMGYRLCAISNNKEPRVKMFCDAVDVPYIYKAGKPSPAGYLKAVSEYANAAAEALFFGDQIFTDIWGANKAGVDSVLVKPIDTKTDEIQIWAKRFAEKPIVKAFFKEKGLAINDYFI